MARTARLVLVLGALILVALIGTVNYLAVAPSALPPLDPSQLIALPDGRTRALGDLMREWDAPEAHAGDAPDDPRAAVGSTADADAPHAHGAHDAHNAHGAHDAHNAHDAHDHEPAVAGAPPSAETAATFEIEAWASREPPDGSDPFDLAEWHRHHGDGAQAEALYRAVPRHHDDYARAQRRLGWDVYTRELDTPALGVSFVQASVAADPLDGNAWQDLARVYLATLGLD